MRLVIVSAQRSSVKALALEPQSCVNNSAPKYHDDRVSEHRSHGSGIHSLVPKVLFKG